MSARFYVYELRDENAVVFYIGKGSGRRMYQHKHKAKAGQATRRAERIREILARGGNVVAAKVFETDDEITAFAEEVRLIAHYGRASLTNETNGGCGTQQLSEAGRERIAAMRRGRKASEITRQRQREAKLGTTRTTETKAKIAAYQVGKKKPWAALPRSDEYKRAMSIRLTGRKMSAEAIRKMSEAKMGHTVSEETRQKISESKKGSIPWNKGRTQQ